MMRHYRKTVTLVITMILMLFAFLPAAASAQTLNAASLNAAGESDPEMLSPGVTQIADSNALLGVRGSYEATSAEKLLNRINEIRKEAYNEGLVSSYVPIKWSEELEYIAQIRAVEASVKEDHLRPKGGYVFDMSVNGVSSYGENLAWGAMAMGAVEMWYSEKELLEKGYSDDATGHYEIMIDPDYKYVGIGSFRAKGNWNCACAEFTMGSGLSENRTSIYGDFIQLIVIPKKDIALSLKGDDLAIGGTSRLTAKAGYNGNNLVLPEINWTSSDESVATVEDGVVTGISKGTATITAELAYYGNSSGMTASKTITVTDQPPKTPTIKYAYKERKSLTLEWEKATYASGYQIQYSLKKSMKAAKTVDVDDVTSARIKGLKASKTYYVRIKAVNEMGESGWSKVKKARSY